MFRRSSLACLTVLCACAAPEPDPTRLAADVAPPRDTASWQPPIGNEGGERYTRAVQPYNLPPWAFARAEREGHTRTLVPTLRLNPFYQGGDFDGDGRLDVAVRVARRASGEEGILLLHGGPTPTVLAGAGSTFGNGGTDFRWMSNWTVRPAAPGESAQGDALEVIKLESAGGLIYREGGAYRWRQLGD